VQECAEREKNAEKKEKKRQRWIKKHNSQINI
jgi:hypothetical protein